MKTAIVILNWNTKGFLEEFLPVLTASVSEIPDTEVIVADNASTDGSLGLMKERFPQVRTMAFERNYGFTGGYNRALSEIEAEYFVLINSDIEVQDGWLEPLTSWMDSHRECGACAPKLHSWQDKDRFEYAGAAGGYLDRFGYPLCRGRVMGRVEQDNGQYDIPKDVFWATGACLMVRSEVYRSLGGLDERFFAHMEEIDLCWRMQLEGWKVTVVPESVVYHVGGGTLPATSPFKLFLNYRNNLLMLSNNLPYTSALDRYREGDMTPEKAARTGLRRARRLILVRKTLDLLSAVIYLFTLKAKCFQAVIRAHKEFGKLDRRPSQTEVAEYLDRNAGRAEIRGRYGKWIVWQSIFKGNRIFEHIESEVI